MSEYFSTKETLEATARNLNLIQWIDRNYDNQLDTDTLTAAFGYAKGKILQFISNRYGSQVESWTSDTVPMAIGNMSDTLVLFRVATTSNFQSVGNALETIYQDVIVELNAIRDCLIDIPGVSDYSETSTDTAAYDSEFDDD